MELKDNIIQDEYYDLQEIETSLKEIFGMHLGSNTSANKSIFKELTIKNFIARSIRSIYKVDNFIIKATSDITGKGLPLGADQCINEFKIYNSDDDRLKIYKNILCPVYAIYESKFLYFTINKELTPLSKNNSSDITIYDYIKMGHHFRNEQHFLSLLNKFKNEWVTKEPAIQNEYEKISTFGYDKNHNLYILDYGIL